MGRLKDGIPKSAVRAYSHLVKIGWDLRGTKKPRLKDGKIGPYPQPTRLAGFLLVMNHVPKSGYGYRICYDEMELLGFGREAVDDALVADFRAEGLLPNRVFIRIKSNGVKDADGVWDYPTTYDECRRCEHKDCPGLYCKGDGRNASRATPNGDREEIACHPFGKPGVAASNFCKHSVPDKDGATQCKKSSTLLFQVIHQFVENGPWRTIGLQSDTYALITTARDADVNFGAALDDAADRLGGWVSGIPGTLYFGVVRKKSPTGAKQVPQVFLKLDEGFIQAREQEMQRVALSDRLIEANMAAAPKLLAGPETDQGPDVESTSPEADSVETPTVDDVVSDAEFAQEVPFDDPDLGPEIKAEDIDLLPPTDPEQPKDPRRALAEEFFNIVVSIATRDGLDPVALSCELTANPQFRGFRDLGHLLGFATDFPERYDKSMTLYMEAARARLGQNGGA